jgi:hypothetical protein
VLFVRVKSSAAQPHLLVVLPRCLIWV